MLRLPIRCFDNLGIGLCELSTVRFVDATGVYPKVMQAVASGLFSAEPDLAIASLALASIIYQVLKGDLLCIGSPCVRSYLLGLMLSCSGGLAFS
jgi:hypothetical protein